MKLNIEHLERKSNRDRSLATLLKSPAIMALGISTFFIPENRNDICDRINIVLQKSGK